jgi:hypothetical protein
MLKNKFLQRRNSIRRKISLIIGILLLLTISDVHAQPVNWLTVSSVRDVTGNVLLLQNQPLLAGHAYNITIEIDVPFNQTLARFEVAIDQEMDSNGPQFWYLLSSKYGGYDPTIFSPGSRNVLFNQVEGVLVLSALFSVPSDITTSESGGLTLRFAKDNFQVIQVSVTGGAIVGKAAFRISDSAIETYLDTKTKKSSLIPTGAIDQTYTTLVNNIIQQAQALYQIGLPEEATALLNIVDPTNIPAPPNTSFVLYMGVGIVLSIVVAIVLALLYLRGRTRHAYTLAIVDEVQRELSGMEVTAAKYDKNLAEKIKNIRDRLSE